MPFDSEQFDSPGVDIALAAVKVQEAGEALERAKERAVVLDRDTIERWHRDVGAMFRAHDSFEDVSNALASLENELEGFLAT